MENCYYCENFAMIMSIIIMVKNGRFLVVIIKCVN